MSFWVFISLYYHFCLSAVPFLAIFACGYYYVGLTTLHTLWRMQREETEALAEEAAAQPLSL